MCLLRIISCFRNMAGFFLWPTPVIHVRRDQRPRLQFVAAQYIRSIFGVTLTAPLRRGLKFLSARRFKKSRDPKKQALG